MATTARLSDREIMSLVYDYIGVQDGYLVEFTYRGHQEFYPRHCDVQIDVATLRKEYGSTRETFLAILRQAEPSLQARIVEGVFAFLPLEKFPADIRPSKAAAHTSLRLAVARLRGQAVLIDDLSITNSTVERAIQDAEVLIREQGNTSGIDRVHTALYGYLRALCKHHGVPIEEQADATRLLKLLRTNAPALQPAPGRDADVLRVQGGLASIVGALNPIRNQASLAHPNETLLDVPEAGLVIDAARTIVNYLNRKLR